MAPQQRRQIAALLPALLVLPKARHDLANRQPPLGATGLCVTQPAPQLPAPRAPSEQGGPGKAGLPPPRVTMRGAALPPSDTAGPCGVERRGVREGKQLGRGAEPPANTALLLSGAAAPWRGQDVGLPPSTTQPPGLTASTQTFSHWAQRWGKGRCYRPQPCCYHPAATRGGEKQPPRHRKRRGGGEGRKENHSPRQTNCSLPRGLGLPESQHPGVGTAGSRSIPLGCPRHLPWGRGTSGR